MNEIIHDLIHLTDRAFALKYWKFSLVCTALSIAIPIVIELCKKPKE